MDHTTQPGPADFLRWLAALPFKRDLCVECGAGRAEFSAYLQPMFSRVIATDSAPPCKSLQYVPVQKCRAEALPYSASSVDLLFSMQAAHYFDLQKHTHEVRRVLRPGGIFAVFSWGVAELPNQVTQAYAPVFEVISPFWETERKWVVSGYKGFRFPGLRIEIPQFHLTKWLTPEGLETEMASWSAVQAASRGGIEFPEPRLASCGLHENTKFECRWRIIGQVYRY